MFAPEEYKKEEEAIGSLLAISREKSREKANELLSGPLQQQDHSANGKKKCNSKSSESDYQLGPWWEGGFKSNNAKDMRASNTALNTKKENKRTGSNKSRDAIMTNRSSIMTRNATRLKSNKTAHQPAADPCFCHFENTREYITQYRENVTFSTMLEYRNELTKASPTEICKRCEDASYHQFDIVRHCHCSGNSPTSSSVCYAALDSDSLSKKLLLSGPSLSRIRAEERNLEKCKYGDEKYKSRKTSPGGGKLWISGSMKNGANSNFKSLTKLTKNRCNVRIKTGNESSDSLRIYTSSKIRYSPRTGSNRPPVNDPTELRCGTPASHLINCLRPKIPQAAIPNRSTSFQACIMPMSVASVEQSKNP